MLNACNQPGTYLTEEPATRTALPVSTSTPTATLPPTLTPISTMTQVQVTPTALYSPIELSLIDSDAYQKALNDIPINRQGDLQISLQDEDGNPMPGYLVKYNQISHDFLFGGVADPFYSDKLRNTGINSLTV